MNIETNILTPGQDNNTTHVNTPANQIIDQDGKGYSGLI